jgi:TIR domain/Bacterial SH3 domain
MGKHVFVSHSHEDLPAADLMVGALEERGVTCWVAPRDVPPGGSYAEALLNAIESASCFVLIYSKHSNVSSHVLREVERALTFGLNIVPVRFDDSAPSKSLDYLLATVHWLSIAPDSRDRSIVKAVEQIAAWVAKSKSTRPSAEPDQGPPSRAPVVPATSAPRRSLLWIGAAILLAIVAGSIWLLASRHPVPAQSARKSDAAAAATPQINQTELPLPVTHRYFASLAKRNATAAYNLLSVDFRRRLSISRYSKNVGLRPPVKLVEANTVSKNEHTASVAAVFEDTEPGSRQPHWQASIDFVFETAGWRIDRMKGLFPASGRPMQNPANESEDETTQDPSQSIPQFTPAPTAMTETPVTTPPPATTPAGRLHQAVYGIVQDPDGIANVRREPSIHAKIIAVVKNGERVEIDQMEGDWVHIILGRDQSGFLHKSRVKIGP